MGSRLAHVRPRCCVVPLVTPPLPPFWTLVEAHGDELLAHARRLGADGEAEDVLQEALLRALRAYPRLAHADHLRAWLYRVTTTTALDAHRVRRRRAGEELSDAPPAVAVAPPEDDFESLIDPLPDRARHALRLRFVDDLDYEGVGAALGCSPEAARQRVAQALKTLRKQVHA